MRLLCKTTLVLVLSSLLVGFLFGQGPGPRQGMFAGSGIRLLLNKSVQEELKMDKEQVEKVAKADKEIREKLGLNDPAKFLELKPEEREELLKKALDAGSRVPGEVLKADQLKRFKQIELQVKGVASFLEDDVQKQLKLSDDQKSDMKEIHDEHGKDMQELFKKLDPAKIQENIKKYQALRAEALQKAVKLLDSDQQKKWKELAGDKFEVKWEFRLSAPSRGSGSGS